MKKHEVHSYVFKTKDYDFFKPRFENRGATNGKVKDLLHEISKHGQLSPIIVDSTGSITDGDHRYFACKQLDLEILYIISNGNPLDEMGSLNQNANNWSIKNAVEHYAKRDYEHYENILKASNYSGVSVSYICEIAGNRDNKKVRAGKFVSDRWDVVFEFLEFHKELKPYITANKSQGFVNALFHVWLIKKISKERLAEKIIEHQDEFIRPLPKKDYKEKMLNIYNKKLKSENKKINFIFNSKREVVLKEELNYGIKMR